MQPKVSIIIPIYNTEKYLKQCLDSVVNQTLKDIQVILVNDGSKDESPAIAKEYADRYDYVEYYSQENGGSAKARNHGLEYAKGEYVGFIDSDDWIELDMFDKLYNAASNYDADIVFCRTFEDETPGSYEYIFPRYGYYNRQQVENEIFPDMMPHVMPKGNFRSIRWSNCLRIYKKSIIDQYHIRSCENVSNCEDLGFNTEITLHANSYYYLDKCLYHNRPNPSSQSRNYVKNMWPRFCKLIADMHRYIDEYNDDQVPKLFNECIFYFSTMTVRNEMRQKDKSTQIRIIQEMLDEDTFIDMINNVSLSKMNQEYTGLYEALKTRNANKVVKYMNKLNFKKYKLYPFLANIISLPGINVVYKKIRHRG